MQRRRSWTTDVAFADVAMAVLGPVLLLLLLFLLYGVRQSTPPACRALDPGGVKTAAAELSAWAKETRALLAGAALDKRCGPPPLPPAGATGMTPAVLNGLCQPALDAVLTGAGLERASLQSLSARRAIYDRHAATCLASLRDNECRRLDAAGRTRAASELSAWLRQTQSLTARSRERMQRDCRTVLEAAPTDIPPPAVPPALVGLCAPDRDAVVTGAGTDAAFVETVERDQRESLARLRVCEPAVDRVELKQEQLLFKACSTVFLDPVTKQPLSEQQIRAFFQTLATDMAARLSGNAFNRIDIFGHTDSRPIQSGACEGAKDNPGLSSLRAHAFRRELEAAIKDDPAFATLRQRLENHDLRIYAIGVGEAELVVKNAASDSDHDRNRRIEIRFATDQFVVKQ